MIYLIVCWNRYGRLHQWKIDKFSYVIGIIKA